MPSTAAVDDSFNIQNASLNSAGALFEQLRDPHNLDFRPWPSSLFASLGIGAYAPIAPGGVYRIAGRREYRASTPVPPDGSTSVRPDADLMFLAASQPAALALGCGIRQRTLCCARLKYAWFDNTRGEILSPVLRTLAILATLGAASPRLRGLLRGAPQAGGRAAIHNT